MANTAIIRAKLRWGSREVERRGINGEWPDEIVRDGIRYAPLLPPHRHDRPNERTYYEVPRDDDDY